MGGGGMALHGVAPCSGVGGQCAWGGVWGGVW
jgi:hypothetical protein